MAEIYDKLNIFPIYLIKEIEETFIPQESYFLSKNWFKTILPICGITYHLDNKYFKDTILEAYNVYVKYDGIYIKFEKPNTNYIFENIDNESEILLLTCYELFNDFFVLKLLYRLEQYINENKLIKSYKLNKSGELIKKDKKELEIIEKEIIANNAIELYKKNGIIDSFDYNYLCENIEDLKKEKYSVGEFKYKILNLILEIFNKIGCRLLTERIRLMTLKEDLTEIKIKWENLKKDEKIIRDAQNKYLGL